MSQSSFVRAISRSNEVRECMNLDGQHLSAITFNPRNIMLYVFSQMADLYVSFC